MKKTPPHGQKKVAKQPKITKDEVADGDLNKVTGGVVVTKRMDASSPGLWTNAVAGDLSSKLPTK